MRTAVAKCPHCDDAMTDTHVRDTGEATERPDGVCRILFDRRKTQLAVEYDRRSVDTLRDLLAALPAQWGSDRTLRP
jgi:hypothetical protein